MHKKDFFSSVLQVGEDVTCYNIKIIELYREDDSLFDVRLQADLRRTL